MMDLFMANYLPFAIGLITGAVVTIIIGNIVERLC